MDADLADALNKVLAPFEDRERQQMIAWATEEMGTRDVISLCVDSDDVEYKIGEQCPANGSTLIFAMLRDDARRCVDVYCAGFLEENGKEGVLYFKLTVWRPKSTWGPMTGQALYQDWQAFFAGEGDGETNGVTQ